MVSDGMLSQDEIDALLRGTEDLEMDNPTEIEMDVENYLSSMEQDALGEIANISFGSSATALSTLLNQKVDITTPTVSIIEYRKLKDEFPYPYVAIQVKYTQGFSGTNLLVIKQSDAAIIADLMLGGDGLNPGDLIGEIQFSAVQEAMNQMMGSSATSMATIFGKKVDISPPSIDKLDFQQGEGTERVPNSDILVKVSFRLTVGDLIDSNIMQLLPLDFAKGLVEELLNPKDQLEPEPIKNENIETTRIPEQIPDHSMQMPFENPANTQVNQNTNMGYDPRNTNSYSIPPNNQGDWQPPYQYNSMPQQGFQNGPQHYGAPFPGGGQPNVQPAVFSSFEPFQLPEAEAKNLNMLLDIPLQVTVELGRTKKSVKEILELSPGSIVELDKLAGEPVDILVNNRLIAKGEVVVIEENFGVRVTDIISQSDRIKKLK